MRGIETEVRRVRKQVFREVANLAYNSTNLSDDMEALPYKLVPGEDNEYWESVYRERAVVRERLRLAMGMSLRQEDAPVHVSQGVGEEHPTEPTYASLHGTCHGTGCMHNRCLKDIYSGRFHSEWDYADSLSVADPQLGQQVLRSRSR